MTDNYKINIIIDTKRPLPKKSVLRNIAKKILALETVRNDVSISLFFTDNKKIKELNRRFLNRDEPTDVISFGANPAPPIKSVGLRRRGWVKGFIGEIAISVEMAEYNARRFKSSSEKEIFLYIVHGILHLLGYGDETKTKKRIMENRQNKILESICGSL